MVHLGQVENDSSKQQSVVEGIDDLQLGPEGYEPEDELTSNVYGSKFAAEDLPRHEMPEGEMPKDVAYRMIKDDLTLDGTPTLKSVSFLLLFFSRVVSLCCCVLRIALL